MDTRTTRRALAGAAAFAALALSGCTGDAFGDDSGRETITYWLWDSAQQPGYQQCADDFEASQDDYAIRIEQRGYDDYWTSLALGLVSESAPDVFTDHLSKYPEYVSRGLLAPLDEYIERDDVPLDIYEDGLADLWIGQDGKRYGLPKDWDAVGLFYDEADLADAGLTAADVAHMTWNPDDGGTYEDVIARLTVDTNGVRGDEPGFDKDHIATYGLWMEGGGGPNFGQTQWAQYAVANGWEFTDQNPWGTHFNFDDPAFVETIAWWQSLVEKGYMPDFASQQGAKPSDQIAAGTAAMTADGSWMIGTYLGYDGVDVGMAPNPEGPTGQNASMFNGLADSIVKDTDHPEGAWQWVRYLASPACQNVIGERHVVFPAITEAWETARDAYAADGVDVSAFTDHVENGTTFLFPIADHAGDVTAVLQPAFDSIMSGADVESTLTGANEEINRLFE
ncbi:sugar ABC transporter substrate-binding protein [Streptomyces sp. NPDC049881]|uniref:ABC transporter substrate-binding protein n=1 Tax=Streptomyces sp. NPDC049881 TaxID=3155778 RepID=UPI0034496C32